MTSTVLSPWQQALRISLFSALMAFGIAGCHTVEYLYPKNMQGFSLPSGCPDGSPPANTTDLNACLKGIEFDTTEFVGDEQRLMVRDSGPRSTGLPCFGDSKHNCRYGPLAKVEPVKGAEMYSNTALAQGRIIARIYLRSGETESYPKFGLVPGDTTYWWVNTAQKKSFFVHTVPRADSLASTPRELRLGRHAQGSFQQAFARWVWDPIDETLNGGCGGHCCKA
jgi:hypothetical protein